MKRTLVLSSIVVVAVVAVAGRALVAQQPAAGPKVLTIEKVKAKMSFGRLISASRLPAMASNDRCFGLDTSSSTSPRRGSMSSGSEACAIRA